MRKIYWYNHLALDHTVCGFCHREGQQVRLITDPAIIALRPKQRLVYSTKQKAAFRAHVKQVHPERGEQIAWSRNEANGATKRTDLAVRSGSKGRPDGQGRDGGVRKARPDASPAGRGLAVSPPSTQVLHTHVTPVADIEANKRRKAAQAQRDEWLRAINSTPRGQR